MSDEWIVTRCQDCGGFCCKAIIVSKVYDPERIERCLPFYWSLISVEEALRVNPYLITFPLDKLFFYTCNMLHNGLCSIYDKRPNTCSMYPYYGASPFSFLYQVPWCVYKRFEF